MGTGPLTGVRVIELAGLGPAPYCGMLLADMGAEVIRVERAAAPAGSQATIDPLQRNRKSIALNLKSADAIQVLLRLVEGADVLIEPFRPGVVERLGIGPDDCLEVNPRLVYGRMTGWGQDGPLAKTVGHDINYLALTGLLHQVGSQKGRPVPPLCFVGDFGSGGMLLAVGILAALLQSRLSGRGQVVDAAIVDGAISMMGIFYAMINTGLVRDGPGDNYLAGSAPWYTTYRTRDGKFVAVGALEAPFYRALLETLELDVQRWMPLGFPNVGDDARRQWPELRAAMAARFASRTQDEWCAVFEDSDACFAPVLDMQEAPEHPHNTARQAFIEVDGIRQNAPAPRFSLTPAQAVQGPRLAGEDTEAVLLEAGYTALEVERLRRAGALS